MSNTQQVDNRRIAKNTILLYVRMLFILFIGLYTSRVVLKVLGVSDYGIYNLVGGFVTMLAYLNSAFIDATQRFLSFALGKDNTEELYTTFATSRTVHNVLALIILIVAETFGIWFVNHQLVISPERLVAANWVFQFSVVSLLITIISVPYNACIIAHEHMHIFAYVGIIEAVLKLVIVFLIQISPVDELITYSFLLVVVAISVRLCYTFYCRKKFSECRVGLSFNLSKFKEMISFSGWVLVGNLGFTFKDQCSNIILNQFFGTAINAARGVATQVSSIVNTFAKNFLVALNPQITKQYAAGNIGSSKKLVYLASKASFYLLGLMLIPIIINMKYLLNIWLVEVPECTYEFIVITLLATLAGSFALPITTAIQATGNIKLFQIGISFIMLLELPLTWYMLKMGYSPKYVLLPAILTNFTGVVFRFSILHKIVPEYSSRYFYVNIVLRSILVFICALIFSNYTSRLFNTSFLSFITTTVISIIITCILIYICGITKEERKLVNSYLTKFTHNR